MNAHSDERHNPGPWTVESREDRTAETRKRIERAALELFVEQGIAETSIRDIATKAHVSQGAMYNHFESKEELAWSLFIDGWNQFGDEMRKLARIDKSLSEKIHSMIGYVFHRFDEDWLLVTYVFSSRHQHIRRVHSTRGNPYTVFRLVIADGMRRGEIPKGDLDLKTALVIGAVIQTIDSRILLRLKGPLSDSATAAGNLCVKMLSA